jgi:aspartate dehydrogenase
MIMSEPIRVGVVGLGAIGADVAQRLDAGIPGLKLVGVAGRNPTSVRQKVEALGLDTKIANDLSELIDWSDVILDCSSGATFDVIARAVLQAKRTIITVNSTALLSHPDLLEFAKHSGGRLLVATGAIAGLDGVVAAAEGEILSVRMVTRKPPRGLAGAPYIQDNGIQIEGLSHPLRIFEGNAREAAKAFPVNANVIASVSLAGIGPERTRVEIWADPTLERNVQHYEVEADAARFSVTVEGAPDPLNPRTSRLTSRSVIATLRRLAAPVQIGT